jgi:hypothetical protein
MRETFLKLCTELEDLWIEKEAYRDFMLTTGIATHERLDQLKSAALADPEIRKETREQFSYMWKALEEVGDAALLEDLSRLPPPSGKPN